MIHHPTTAHRAPDARHWAFIRRLGFGVLVLGLCGAFVWPGRVAHLAYQAAHGSALERRQAVRLLAQYPAPAQAALLAALDDDDLAVQLAAAEALGELRAPEATATLLDWLADKEAARRAAAVRALGAIGDPRASDGLVRALADSDASVRLAAVEAVAARAGALSNALSIGLDDKDSRVRAGVAEAFVATPDPSALAALSGHVRDEAAEVRINCLRALGRLHDSRSVPVLTSALADPDETVRLAALAAFGDSGQPAAVAPLRASLSAAPRLARTALAALSRIDDTSAKTTLLGTLDDPELAAPAADALVERLQRTAAGDATPERGASANNASSADATEIVLGLATALERATTREQATHLAGALHALAVLSSIVPAQPSLMAALAAGRADPRVLTEALVPLAPSELLPLLLERLERSAPAERSAVLDALIACFAAGLGDGRAVEPLAAALAQARDSERGRLLQLLGETGAARALPLLLTAAKTENPTELRVIASAIGALPGSENGRRALWPLLTAADAELRDAGATAFARSAEPSDLSALLNEIDGRGSVTTGYWLALTGSLGRLGPALDAKLHERVVRAIGSGLRAAEPSTAALALNALRQLHDPRSSVLLAERLHSVSASGRAAAILALGDFPSEDTRRLLRYVLMNDAPPVVLAAMLALGEVGDQRDGTALLKAAERGVWPLSAAAAYALARMAQRGAGKKHALQRALCTLGQSREVLVRVNVAAGLSALAADRCDERIDPLRWLGPAEPPLVRRAAAAWALAAADGGVHEHVHKLCTESSDAALHQACAAPQPSAAWGQVDVHAYAADGRSPLPDRLVAVSALGAGVFIAPTDANAHLLVPAPLGRPLQLLDPADTDFAAGAVEPAVPSGNAPQP